MEPYIVTYSGAEFNFETLDVSGVTIIDVAHALSNLCRYNGHCSSFYSVAQHSVLVSYSVPPWAALEGLMHDATEAFLGDMTAPLKQYFPRYKQMEERLEILLAKKFRYEHPMPEVVKQVDLAMLLVERARLMPEGRPWAADALSLPPLKEDLLKHIWTPEQARIGFMNRYCELIANRRGWALEPPTS